MLKKLLIIVIALMFVEMGVFIAIGSKIGILWTLLLVATTSFIGVLITKKLGLQAFQQLQLSIASGQPPATALIEGVLITVGALLFILPGFLSDIAGLIFIIPVTRKLLLKPIYKLLRNRLKLNTVIINKKYE